MLMAGTCERSAKRGEMTRSCRESFTKPFTAKFLAPLTESGGHKTRLEALALENQCTLGVAAVTKKLQKKLTDREKTDATAKATPKGRRRKRATAAYKRVDTLELEPAKAKIALARLVRIAV